MKNPLMVVIFILFNLSFVSAWSHIKLAPTQIKEIVVHNATGSLGGGLAADMEVILEDGKWHSYLTRKTSSLRIRNKSYDSTLHKLIATINPIIINRLLNGIAIIKPVITPATFRLTPLALITELKDSATVPITHSPDFAKLIRQKVINNVISKTVVDMNVMDDFEYCQILIITLKNDTIKLDTRNLCPTKQPWAFNNKPTYNMAFNNFVVVAMGTEDLPNKTTLNINCLKECIYKYVDERNTGDPISTFRWTHNYPGNLKLLTEHFTIKQRFMTGNVYQCTLKTKTMPSNAIFEARINMARKQDIQMIIDYGALIDQYFNANNFVFNYYSNRPKTQIDFSYNTGQTPYYSLTYLSKKLPDQAKIDSSQTISFWIAVADDSSYWIMFPDHKALLTYHSVTTPHGETAPIYPPQDRNATWYTKSNTYYLFDGAGKVLSQGIGF
ncbi:hypothetical protein [Mucilaginibacter sp. FT3.2]|uniref:hypothetical protein n=1 Tax=Mucilaginibacter sp. FT3.2 TaxID=2723090 RepID=UPI0016078CC6|nr:hypothetical protein [Mucilaginibacter sp. FT3.2]MBB6231495.1 hypothetical protein [Mucilaginibacter sp. FT3.2]